MEYLKANGVDACGTIRSHRKGLPLDLKADNNMMRGECDCRVSKWALYATSGKLSFWFLIFTVQIPQLYQEPRKMGQNSSFLV